MLSRVMLPALAGSMTLVSLTPALGVGIADIAPENTVFVIEADSVTQTRDRFQRTALWDMMQSDDMSDSMGGMMPMDMDFEEGMSEMLEQMGIDREDFTWPDGGLGFAVYPVSNDDGLPIPAMMVSLSYSKDAGRAERVMDAIVDSAREEGMEINEIDLDRNTVYAIELDVPNPMGEEDFGDMDMMGGMMPFDMSSMTDAFTTLYITRHEGRFIATSALDSLGDALEAAGGEGGDRLADRSAYQSIMEQVGDGDMRGAMFTRDLPGLAGAIDPMGMTMMLTPMLKQYIGTIDGMAVAARFDGSSSMVEKTLFVSMPHGKAGLSAAFDQSAQRSPAPAFVGPDAFSYSRLNIDFNALGALVGQALGMVQGMMGGMPMGDGPDPAQIIAQVTQSLGGEVHIVQVASRPIEADKVAQVFAIQCTNQEQLEQTVAAMGAGLGLEGRDFLGHRIYAMDPAMMGGMMPMGGGGGDTAPAIGIGGGFLFAGASSASVEAILRRLSDTEAPKLGAEAMFKRAVAPLGNDDVIAWGYADAVMAAEVQQKVTEAQMEEIMEMFGDDEMDEEMMAEMMGPMGLLSGVPSDMMRKYIGPSAWEIRSVDTGFLMKFYMQDAAGK